MSSSFCPQVEVITNPQLVAEILSPKSEMGMALTEELEHGEEVSVGEADWEGQTQVQQGKRQWINKRQQDTK